jgi:hypothetical protein
MALVTDARLMEAFSLALEHRQGAIQDLVSNSNVVFDEFRTRGSWKTFSGQTIRVPLLYAESGTYVRYQGYDFLNPQPVELVNDAVFEPKMGAVSVTLSNEDILKNSGEAQLHNIFKVHIEAAEEELKDRFTEDMHSAGAEYRQIGGLQIAVPTTPTNTYGGIERSTANAIWKTTTYNANSITVGGTAITTVSSTTIKPLLNHIFINRSRGNKGPNLFLMDGNHFQAYSAATEAIQKVDNNTSNTALGFTKLKYYGVGKSVDIVLEGGIGSAMPADVTYALDMSALAFYYHPDRPVGSRIGSKQMPINQDAIVQHMGFMGELVLSNPLHQVKLYDSTP